MTTYTVVQRATGIAMKKQLDDEMMEKIFKFIYKYTYYRQRKKSKQLKPYCTEMKIERL